MRDGNSPKTNNKGLVSPLDVGLGVVIAIGTTLGISFFRFNSGR